MLCLAVALLSACEPHCVHPCEELNGDVAIECDECHGSPNKCHPGADGFTRPVTRVALTPAGGSAPPSAIMAHSSNENAPASDFSLPATPADSAEVKRSGGDIRGCRTAACARVALRRLSKANAALAPRGANVTAGGEEVPCEFQRTTRYELAAMTQSERADFLTRLPSIVSGLTDGWPALEEWSDPQRFSARYGHHQLKAVRSMGGFYKLQAARGAACAIPGAVGCSLQQHATVALAESVPWSDEEQIVIMDLHEMSRGEYALLTDLSTEYETPEFLDALSNVRLLSLGGRPEGVQMSRHDSAWLAVVAGAKLWHVAPPSRPQPANRYCPGRGKIDYQRAAREGVLHCMAHPGEVVVVPDGWWHATCNMLPYTLAVGGQTWDGSVPAEQRFAARSDAAREATTRRWQQRTPRRMNSFQASLADVLPSTSQEVRI